MNRNLKKTEKTEKARELAREYVDKARYAEKNRKPAQPASTASPSVPATPSARSSPSRSLKETIALAALALALIVAFVFIAFYLPGAHWERVNAVGAQYYEYLAIFNGDESELNALSNGYTGLPLDNSTLDRKVAFASAYALNAKHALTSWNYFDAFLSQNEGLLRDYNVDAAAAKNKINAAQTEVEKQARLMRSELKEFAGANVDADASAAVEGVLNSLEEVGPVAKGVN